MNPAEPIVISVDLAIPPAAAFAAFTGRFGEWWPAATHSLSRNAASRCCFALQVGGRVDEQTPDGSHHLWGKVLALEPDHRVRFSWHPGREPDTAQWIEVVFVAVPGGTRVTLTHGGWEALGEIGPLLRQEYVPGWQHVLGRLFSDYAQAAH